MNNENIIIGIRVDVDTLVGLRKGVDNLLNLFRDFGIQASFFIPMGPDTLGRVARRIGRRGFINRILKLNPIKLLKNYGLKPFFYGTLLSPPNIGKDHPDILKRIQANGHEVGIHGYDHAEWQDHYDELDNTELLNQIKLAIDSYSIIFGVPPNCSAAPGWRANENTLSIQDSFNFLYLSDFRGRCPFYPKIGSKKFKTLQIPVTLPTLDEVGLNGKALTAIYCEKEIDQKINILNIHAEYEGLQELNLFKDFLSHLKDIRICFKKLGDIAKIAKQDKNTPLSEIEISGLKGVVGEVAKQGRNSI